MEIELEPSLENQPVDLLPFLDDSQARAALDDGREGEVVGQDLRFEQELVEEEEGVMGSVVVDVAFDDDVPGMGGGFLHAVVEDGPGVVERADLGIGIGVEREEGRGDGVHLPCLGSVRV